MQYSINSTTTQFIEFREHPPLKIPVNYISFNDYLDYVKNISSSSNLKNILFRGHSDSDYKLIPTLGREQKEKGQNYSISSKDMHNMQKKFKKNSPWIINPKDDPIILLPLPEDHTDYRNDFKNSFINSINLRQYGCPSPLLDWTTNCLIALYFALENYNFLQNIAIYHLIETKENLIFGPDLCRPHIRIIYIDELIKAVPNNLNSNSPILVKRHNNQKGVYTVCISQRNTINTFHTFSYEKNNILTSNNVKMEKFVIIDIKNNYDKAKTLLIENKITKEYIYEEKMSNELKSFEKSIHKFKKSKFF